jgi:Cu/Ag efflux pump CusA
MLLASGIGSAMSRRLLPDPLRARGPLAIIVIGILLYAMLLPVVFTRLVGLSIPLKLAMSAAMLFPLGFVMGMPFPSGLRALHGAGGETVEWAWALNAASSVLGSVLAMVIAIQSGLQATLICGALAYVAAALLTTAFPPQRA